MKIITIIGARPQFIKCSILSDLIKEYNNIEEKIIHTGQHFDKLMSEIFFKDLNIPIPDYNLNISNLAHGAMTGRMLEEIEKILIKEKPDITLVYGDTNSTLAGALASSKLDIPIAHVEAGLRSFNKKMPEETNRKLTDHISTYLFCPTIKAIENLNNEGITSNIEIVGDIMYDLFIKHENQEENIHFKDFCLLTLHRQENTEKYEVVYNLLKNLNNLMEEYNYRIIFPLHPRTSLLLQKNNFDFNEFKQIVYLPPLSYVNMILLEKTSKIIFTDSGGIQKEAYWSKTPCITLREETEWTELVDIGVNILTGLNIKKIENAIEFFMNANLNYDKVLYGNGDCGQKILDKIM